MRPAKNPVDPFRPYAWLVEDERTADGIVEPVSTLFLTNRECPFRCVYCDLWKNTTDETVPRRAIPAQIDFALSQLPPARHIKLYNSGNFFDVRAIPPEDYPAIAQRVAHCRTVIVENHPRLCAEPVLRFRDLLPGHTQFEIAMGLETIDPDTLPRLEKQMSLDDFSRACEFLRKNNIAIRAFVLLKAPWQNDESTAVDWAIRSVQWAINQGVRVTCVIPTRRGNAAMEDLHAAGQFNPPQLPSLEEVLDTLLQQKSPAGDPRVFVDTWDLAQFASCTRCLDARRQRLETMNRTQTILPAIPCECRAS